ncbi:Similar to DNAJC9: DnaJ homolog subfamily C member 9 (Homo sapiens) [Cotesia congregata]|uniref:Similar to DNAJC9: DnaJ homolog subfamily C member 9 (Homo sapiens) n=1 Tax=Cotesia congregata TaxID=51543 RepID=A0A8J2HAC8_COTCN|nr:Similar to DNAJC9: DnaJ homolog subfamily C member 9 (Homo sapiens) [Cotesia congregata]
MAKLHDLCEKYFGSRNFYEVLEIPKTASDKEVKKAYHKLSLLVHPDRVAENKKEEATEKFQVLGFIHSILSDTEKRKIYDETGQYDEESEEVAMRNWADYWRTLFKEVTIEDINKYEKDYKGSETEIKDLKRAYTDKAVPFTNCDEEPRLHAIIQKLIEDGEVPEYKAFTNENEKKKARRKRKVRKILEFIFLLVSGFILKVSSACTQVKNEDMIEYSCENGTLADLYSIPERTEKIRIANIDLSHLTANTFGRFGDNLWVLSCSHCSIQEIDDDAFKTLTSLQQLRLDNNNLRVIKAQWFQGLKYLTYLDFNYNEIESIEDGVFANLPGLVDLRIAGNKLQCLNIDEMSHLVDLKRVFLNRNPEFKCPNAVNQLMQSKNINYERDDAWDKITHDLIQPKSAKIHEILNMRPEDPRLPEILESLKNNPRLYEPENQNIYDPPESITVLPTDPSRPDEESRNHPRPELMTEPPKIYQRFDLTNPPEVYENYETTPMYRERLIITHNPELPSSTSNINYPVTSMHYPTSVTYPDKSDTYSRPEASRNFPDIPTPPVSVPQEPYYPRSSTFAPYSEANAHRLPTSTSKISWTSNSEDINTFDDIYYPIEADPLSREDNHNINYPESGHNPTRPFEHAKEVTDELASLPLGNPHTLENYQQVDEMPPVTIFTAEEQTNGPVTTTTDKPLPSCSSSSSIGFGGFIAILCFAVSHSILRTI